MLISGRRVSLVAAVFSMVLLGLFGQTVFAAEKEASKKLESGAKKAEASEEKNEVEESPSEKPTPIKKVEGVLAETRERRSNAKFFGMVSYSPIDLLIPSKYGVTAGWVQDPDTTWELEYLRGSISVPFLVKDLGQMTDYRLSLIRRSYFGGNSFNFSYGLSYFGFSLHLGDEILSRVSGGGYPSIDLIELNSIGFNIGVGNRWTFDHNITLGVDWISWAQPVVTTKRQSAFLDYASNQQDKDDVDRAIKFISYFPRLSLLKVQLGLLF